MLRTAIEQDDLTGAFRRGEFLRRAESALPVATTLGSGRVRWRLWRTVRACGWNR